MRYGNSNGFEFAVLGCCASSNPFSKTKLQSGSYRTRIKKVISAAYQSGKLYPDTVIGRSLYCHIKKELKRFGVDTEGLALIPTVGTSVDVQDYADAVVYVPSVGRPVSIDLFNLHTPDYLYLKGVWEDSHELSYSESEIQDELYAYKEGARIRWWVQGKSHLTEGIKIFHPEDLRHLANRKRPQDHFVLTPYHASSPKRRKEFGIMVASYLAEVGGYKTAQQSHKSPICA